LIQTAFVNAFHGIQFPFASDGCLKDIAGFAECTSLSRMEIPSLVQMITHHGVKRSPSTRAVVFASEYTSLIIYQAHFLQHLQPPIHLQVRIINESIERPSAEAQISSRG
jgi:hypothetical protein